MDPDTQCEDTNADESRRCARQAAVHCPTCGADVCHQHYEANHNPHK